MGDLWSCRVGRFSEGMGLWDGAGLERREGMRAGLAQAGEPGALWAQECGVGGEGRWRALHGKAGRPRDPHPAGLLRAFEQVTYSSQLRVCHVQSEEFGTSSGFFLF